MTINWDAFAAVGQWLGALATFLAVIVALKQGKPKVRVKAGVYDVVAAPPGGKFKKIHDDRLYISVTNIGTVPIKIVKIGFRWPRSNNKKWSIINSEPGVLPKVLMPSEEVDVWTEAKGLREKGINKFDIAIAMDSAGKVHYHEANIFRKITRFIWWNIGRVK
ncbi:MAG TPA: hypothetical protein PK728_04675 [Bacillota bacterium]|nr:hypothetical protein [Bacillota bacterium]